jgi:hypothetical protein
MLSPPTLRTTISKPKLFPNCHSERSEESSALRYLDPSRALSVTGNRSFEMAYGKNFPMSPSAEFISPTTRTRVPPWPRFCETTCNSAARPRHLAAACGTASETRGTENGTKRHNCGRQRRTKGIKRNDSGMLRFGSAPFTATFSPTGTLQGCKSP